MVKLNIMSPKRANPTPFGGGLNVNKLNLMRYSEKKNLNTINNKINPDYIVGFIDGEGCFSFYIGKQTKTTIQLQASLEIA